MSDKSDRALRDELRATYIPLIRRALEENGEEVLVVGSANLAIPCVDSAGNDRFITIDIKCPTGSREGDIYDGYALAEDYEMRAREAAEKAEKVRAQKEAKIARDAAKRAAAAEARLRAKK